MELSKELISKNGEITLKKSLGKGLDSLIRSNNKPDPLSKIDNSELFTQI